VLEKLRDGISLNGPEKDIANRIPEFGARLLENIPRLQNVANIVRCQEKHFEAPAFPRIRSRAKTSRSAREFSRC